MRRNLIPLALVAALAAGAVFAQTARGGLAQGKQGLGANLRQRVMKNLNLSDAQKTQAKAIFQEAKQAAAPIRTQLHENRQAMASAIKSNNTSQITALARAAGTLQGQLMEIRSTGTAKFYAILTPDQQTKLNQMEGKIKQMLQQFRTLGQTAG
jgi:Spy/CpxP family protein refolding chaperone